MRKFIKLSLVFVTMVLIATGLGASEKSADQIQAEKTAQAMNDANKQIGMPAIKNWQEKKFLKMLYELRDQAGIVRYAYLKSLKSGKPIYLGKCIGYGLPYCVQFSNPERVAHQDTSHSGSFGTMPQPEPNGLFMPQTLSATWLMMINPKTGEPEPVYVEPEIIVNPFPLPYATGNPKDLGNDPQPPPPPKEASTKEETLPKEG